MENFYNLKHIPIKLIVIITTFQQPKMNDFFSFSIKGNQ